MKTFFHICTTALLLPAALLCLSVQECEAAIAALYLPPPHVTPVPAHELTAAQLIPVAPKELTAIAANELPPFTSNISYESTAPAQPKPEIAIETPAAEPAAAASAPVATTVDSTPSWHPVTHDDVRTAADYNPAIY